MSAFCPIDRKALSFGHTFLVSSALGVTSRFTPETRLRQSRSICRQNSARVRATSKQGDSGLSQNHDSSAPRLLQLSLAVGAGVTGTSSPAHADIMETIEAGTSLIQKDTIIGIAFGTAILALGAVTIGVSFCPADACQRVDDLTYLQALHDHH